MSTLPSTTSLHGTHDLASQAPGESLRDHAVTELDSAIAGLGWRGGRVHGGVHQARKALRRVRSTLALGGDALGPGAVLVDRELRKANHGLSTLRDAQALVETLTRLIPEQRDADLLRVLRRARRITVARRAVDARAALAADPQLGARRDLLWALRGAMLALPWQRLTASQVQAALTRGADRIGQAQALAVGSDRDDDWHRWRRRERRLSQQRRALKATGVAHLIAMPKIDKRLALQLGAAQDVSLLRDHCGRESPFTKADRVRLKQFARAELAMRRLAIIAIVEEHGATMPQET